MADIDKRLKYYNGQFLREQDFTAEQEYHLDRMRRHAGQLHTPGVADGLNVTATVGAVSAVVSPGTALDKEGRQIFLREPYNVAFESSHNGQWVLVVIAYAQEPADEATVGDVGMTRWLERPEVTVVLESGAPPADMRIRLARLRIAANGTIAEHDPSVRTPAGARVRPHETFESLRLSRPGGSDSSQWPVLTSGAANRADLAGNLSVNGNILVTGTVDGRDVSADGAKLDTLAASQIEGVSNPGGNIDLVGQNGITVTGNDSANTITIAGGSPTSIANVSNPGGNIAINGAGGITVGADDNANAITISTSASAIGALPAGDYLKREEAYVTFYGTTTTGTLTSVGVSFLPKMIWVTGRTYAQLFAGNDDLYFGGVTQGHCKVSGPGSFTQEGHGPDIRRFSQNWDQHWSIKNYGTFGGGIAKFYFDDRSVSPRLHVEFQASVANVTSGEIVLSFSKSHGGYTLPSFAFMGLYLTILG